LKSFRNQFLIISNYYFIYLGLISFSDKFGVTAKIANYYPSFFILFFTMHSLYDGMSCEWDIMAALKSCNVWSF